MSTLPPPTAPAPGAPLPPPGRPGRLSGSWRLGLASAWGAIMAALGLVANTGVILGSPPWWLSTVVLPFLLPAVVLLALAIDAPWALKASLAAAVSLVVVAVLDVREAPAMAVAEGVLAVAALLVTLAARAGRR